MIDSAFRRKEGRLLRYGAALAKYRSERNRARKALGDELGLGAEPLGSNAVRAIAHHRELGRATLDLIGARGLLEDSEREIDQLISQRSVAAGGSDA